MTAEETIYRNEYAGESGEPIANWTIDEEKIKTLKTEKPERLFKCKKIAVWQI